MTVKLLTAFAGDDMTFRYGEIVDFPEVIARAQVEAGNAEFVNPAEAIEDPKPAADKKKK